MSQSAPKPCTHSGCCALVYDGAGGCAKHRPVAWSVKRPVETKRITGRKLQRLREELFAQEPLCVACIKAGRIRLATQRDHIVPLFEGGADDESNTQGLCDDCHDVKSQAERLRAQGRGGQKV
ncbi:HNH endonuclease [Paralcaligenes ginsengisoli]